MRKNRINNEKGKSTWAAKPSFSPFFLPMDLGETLAFFLSVLGSDGKSNERHRKKTRKTLAKKRNQYKKRTDEKNQEMN